MNLPTGKVELNNEEFSTSLAISQNYYDFRAPILGQGLNILSSASAAFPLSQSLVVGFGVSYQVKNSLLIWQTTRKSEYLPGNEFLLTGGFDVRLNSDASISTDLTYGAFEHDEIDGIESFQAGNKWYFIAQYLQFFGQDNLRVTALIRRNEKGSFPVTNAAIGVVSIQTIPHYTAVNLTYRYAYRENASASFILQERYYSTSDRSDTRLIFDLGVQSSVTLTESVQFNTRLLYSMGDLTGIETGDRVFVFPLKYDPQPCRYCCPLTHINIHTKVYRT